MRTIRLVGLMTLAAVGGCATNTGVIPLGGNVYTVARQGGSLMENGASVRAAALKEALAFCEDRNGTYKALTMKETPRGAFGQWPEAEVVFACE